MQLGGSLDAALLDTLFGESPFGVALLDVDGRFLRVNPTFAAANGPAPEEHVGRLVEEVLGEGGLSVRALVDKVVASGRALPPEDVSVVDARGELRTWRTSWLPAHDGDRLVGVVAVGMESTAEVRAEDARDVAEERLRLLASTATLLEAGLDEDAVCARLAGLLVPLAADWSSVHLLAEDGRVRVAAVASDAGMPGERFREVLDTFEVTTDQPYGAGYAIATGQVQVLPEVSPEVIRAVAGDDEGFYEAALALGAKEGLIVPLVSRGRVLGAVSVARTTDRAFRVELEDLGEVILRAALALDYAQLYQRQAQIALTLQRSLLPAMPTAPEGLDVAVRYVPGVADLEVGGDFYDVVALPDGTVGLAIGDVMGRGLHAAAVMGQLRAALRAYAQLGIPPAQLLTLLDGVVSSLDPGSLVTTSYAVLDSHRGSLALATAGHLPPVLRLPDGTTQVLEVPVGPPLGSGRASHDLVEHPLPPGAVLVLCTDGLVEDRGRDIDTGLELLRSTVEGGPSEPEALADAVLASLGRAQGHDDDVAVLVVRATGQPEVELERLALTPLASNVPLARHWLEEHLPADDPEQRDTALLLCSELVTNAVLHARTDLKVSILSDEGGLRVEVTDGSRGLPETSVTGADDEATTGRGTLLLEALADRWGVEEGSHGKCVWFELGQPERRSTATGALEARAETSRVLVLQRLPLELWLAAQRHHDAVLRELQLSDEADPAELDGAARVRWAIAVSAGRLVGERSALGLPRGAQDVVVELTGDLVVDDVMAFRDLVRRGEDLAASGALLTRPALPEVLALTEWVAAELMHQLDGGEPGPWKGDDSRVLLTGSVVVDEDHRIAAVDAVLAESLGWAPTELVGERLTVLVPEPYREAHVAGFARWSTTGHARVLGQELDFPVRARDGRHLPARVLVQREPGGSRLRGRITLVAP